MKKRLRGVERRADWLDLHAGRREMRARNVHVQTGGRVSHGEVGIVGAFERLFALVPLDLLKHFLAQRTTGSRTQQTCQKIVIERGL